MYSATTVNYITLFNSIIMFVMSGIASSLSFILLRYNYKFSKILSFSPTMLLYFFLVFVSCFQTCFHGLYQVIQWRIDGPLYDPVYVYIGGAISGQSQATVPLVEFFVCLDRIFTVIYPGGYSGKKRWIPVISAIVIAFCLQFAYNYAFDFIGGIPFEWNRSKGLLQIYQKNGAMIYSTIKKGTISICSFTATICFYFIIQKVHFNNHRAKKLNKAILYMLIVSIFADFLPNVSYGIGMIIGGNAANDILGPFSLTFTSINIGLSSILYWNAFRKIYQQAEISKSVIHSRTPGQITPIKF